MCQFFFCSLYRRQYTTTVTEDWLTVATSSLRHEPSFTPHITAVIPETCWKPKQAHWPPQYTHTHSHTHVCTSTHTHTLTPTLRSLTAQANCCTKMGLPSTKRVIKPTGVSNISPLRCWEVAASNRGNSWAENRQLEKTQSFPSDCWHVQAGTSARNRFCILLSPCSFLRIMAVKLTAK